MIKIAMIGAGSVVFSRNLTGDILGYPEFKDATIAYMDIDAERLAVGAALCRKVAAALGAHPRIEATHDLSAALAGADFVINMVQIGGFDSTLVDFEIPRKYGLNFTIADTTGPGGMFRALRTFPMLRDLCRRMSELCPNALLLNYSNPMSMNMQTIGRTSGVRAIGLCHSVQGTLDQLMRYISEDPTQVAFTCAGINHMAFYLSLRKNNEDLYPRLFDAMQRSDVYNTNKVRFEIMRRLGYFVTESSEHAAEYCPWFIPHGARTIGQFSVPIDEYLRRCDASVEEFRQMKALSLSDHATPVRRSHEYGSTIIHSMVTGRPSVVYGNMPNGGAIANLPADAIAEAPTVVDRGGAHFTTVGALPPQLLAFMQPHVAQHELFIRAALEGRRDYVYQAAMFDPLTAATLTPDRIVEMCDELIAAHGDLLPRMDARTLVPTSGKSFGRAEPLSLRESWRAARERAVEDYIAEWQVIGPFKSDTPGKVSLEMPTPVDRELAGSAGGAVDLDAAHKFGGQVFKWKPARARQKDGQVLLTQELGAVEWCVGWACARVESTVERAALMRCGSDDGIRVYVNGELVHVNEVGRAYVPNSDAAVVKLKAGVNWIVVKIDNYTAGWGFGVAVEKPRG